MTTKKKTLLELMIEAGIQWPEGAEYAAQDGDRVLAFYKKRPRREVGLRSWIDGRYVAGSALTIHALCRNWHQSVVTRAQYEAAVAEQPEQPATIEPQPCGSATPATIEQRIAELRVMERNLAEFRAKLTDDLHALGITWLDGAICDAKPEQPVITDWRDLRVGDVVGFDGIDGEYTVIDLESKNYSGCAPIKVAEDTPVPCPYNRWPNVSDHQWRFIRRP